MGGMNPLLMQQMMGGGFANPYAAGGLGGAGFGGAGAGTGVGGIQPDTRPPREKYAT